MGKARYPLDRILAAVINAREQQDVRVSRLLHDEVGQLLSAVGLQLDVLRMDVEAASPETARRIQECQQHLEQAMEHVRRLNHELNPAVVEKAGFQAALDRLVGRFRDRQATVRLLYDSSTELPVEAAKVLYKIAECALDNAVRHAAARRIEVFVKRSRAGVTLEVRDDGAGFDLDTVTPGLGLPLMEHYAGEAGLDFTITSMPGQGTIVKTLHPAAS